MTAVTVLLLSGLLALSWTALLVVLVWARADAAPRRVSWERHCRTAVAITRQRPRRSFSWRAHKANRPAAVVDLTERQAAQ